MLTLIAIAMSAVVAGLVLGSLWVALAGEAGSVPIIVPWPLLGAVLAGCVVIVVLTSAGRAWLQLLPRRRRPGSIPC